MFKGLLTRYGKALAKRNPEAMRKAMESYAAQAPGSKDNPYVIECPRDVEKARAVFRKEMENVRRGNPDFPLANELQLDQMIAEMVKMGYLSHWLGAEGKEWQAGERKYLPNSIQTQVIHFPDSRNPIVFYTDFSRFGGFDAEQIEDAAKPAAQPLQEAPRMSLNENAGNRSWSLCRGEQRLGVNGATLAALFLSACYDGWSPPEMFSPVPGGMGLKLKPCSISNEHAWQLARILSERAAKTTHLDEPDPDLKAVTGIYLNFFAGGAFQLREL